MNRRTYIAAGVLAAGMAMSGTAYAADAIGKGAFEPRMRGMRGAIESQLLGITQDEFKTRIQNGENPKGMLEAAGITRDEVRAALQTQAKENLSKAVSDGRITQEEANQRLLKMEERHARHRAIETALANKDYTAWSALVVNTPIAKKVTESNFAKFAEAHALMENGDHEAAKAIMDELGITPPHGKHKGNKFHNNEVRPLDR